MPCIAIDYTPAYEQGAGIGRLVRDLVKALAQVYPQHPYHNQYRLFVCGVGGGARAELPPTPGANFTWKPTRLTPLWLARGWHRARLPLPVEVFTGRVDLFHATDFVLPPTLPGTKTIVTVHDLSFVHVPEAAPPQLRAYLNQVVPRSVKRATHVLADSEATRQDLIRLYKLPPDKVTTLLSGVDGRFRPVMGDPAPLLQKYKIPPRPYIFSVGTVQPRKNYSRLIQALALLRAERRDLSLVIAGGRGWLDNPIYQTINDTGMSDYVHFIGFADDDDLPALYSHAACVAYPSLYEGFGFPVLEGMACGTPVMTSDLSSLPEVAGDAALLVNPYDVDAIAHALRRLLDEAPLREMLIGRGFAQVKKFTWERSARHLTEIYQRVLGDL